MIPNPISLPAACSSEVIRQLSDEQKTKRVRTRVAFKRVEEMAEDIRFGEANGCPPSPEATRRLRGAIAKAVSALKEVKISGADPNNEFELPIHDYAGANSDDEEEKTSIKSEDAEIPFDFESDSSSEGSKEDDELETPLEKAQRQVKEQTQIIDMLEQRIGTIEAEMKADQKRRELGLVSVVHPMIYPKELLDLLRSRYTGCTVNSEEGKLVVFLARDPELSDEEARAENEKTTTEIMKTVKDYFQASGGKMTGDYASGYTRTDGGKVTMKDVVERLDPVYTKLQEDLIKSTGELAVDELKHVKMVRTSLLAACGFMETEVKRMSDDVTVLNGVRFSLERQLENLRSNIKDLTK